MRPFCTMPSSLGRYAKQPDHLAALVARLRCPQSRGLEAVRTDIQPVDDCRWDDVRRRCWHSRSAWICPGSRPPGHLASWSRNSEVSASVAD